MQRWMFGLDSSATARLAPEVVQPAVPENDRRPRGAPRQHRKLKRLAERRRAVVEEHGHAEVGRRLADRVVDPAHCGEPLNPGVELHAAHAVLSHAARDLVCGACVAGSTVANATNRSPAVNAASESLACGARPQQPVEGEHDREPDAELVHRRPRTPPVRTPPQPGWWTWKSITPARRVRHRLASAIRSASSRLRTPRSSPGTGGVPASAVPDEALELEREADLGLVAGRLVRLRRPSASSTSRRNVGGSSVARPSGPVTTNWLCGSTGVSQTTSRRATVPSAYVRTPPLTFARVAGIGAQAPARDLDRRLAEQVVDPVADVDAVGDDRRQSLERAQPTRVGDGIPLGVGGLVAQRCLDQQRRPSAPPRQLPQPVDRGVVPVRRGRSGAAPPRPGLAHVGGLGDRQPERLLREHPLAGLERRTRRGRGGRAAWR